MKKKWGVFLSFLFFVQTIVCAIDSERIIYELSKLYGKELPPSFFVIQANTLLPSFTQGPQIVKQIDDIRKKQLCPFIFIIWKDEGGVGKHFYRFVKENYNLDTNKFLKIYLSDTIYNILGLNHPNTAVHYFYNLTHYKTIDGKYERLTDILPYDLIKVTFDKKCLMEDDNYYHTNQVSYFGINDTLAIEFFDSSQDYIRLTNLTNGKIFKIFDLSQIDYLGKFQNYMNYLNLSAEEVKQGNDFLKNIKRTPLKIYDVYIKNVSEIYLLGSCIIAYKTRKKYYIPSEFKKETITLKPGDVITSNFGIIIKTDTSFKVREIKILDEIKDNEYNTKNFVDITSGFYLKDKDVYTLGYNYFREKDKTYRQFYKRNKKTNFIHKFTVDSLFISFQEKGKSPSYKTL